MVPLATTGSIPARRFGPPIPGGSVPCRSAPIEPRTIVIELSRGIRPGDTVKVLKHAPGGPYRTPVLNADGFPEYEDVERTVVSVYEPLAYLDEGDGNSSPHYTDMLMLVHK